MQKNFDLLTRLDGDIDLNIEEGDTPAYFAVMMSRRLDDPVKAELEKSGITDPRNIAIRYVMEENDE